MSPTVELSQQTFSRLQKYAVPLVDDIQTVINRLADFYDTHGGKGNGSAQPLAQLFNPASPPDLTHTRVLSIKFAGTELDHVQHNWNRLLDQAISVAFVLLKDPKKVTSLLHINCIVGKKDDQGYRFLQNSGISVQGQDANGAWRAVYRITKELNIPFDLEFMWAQKEGLAYAGQTGRFLSN